MGIERRRDARIGASLPVRLVTRGGEEALEMVDASFRGLFARMSNPRPINSLVKLGVSLPDREIILHAVIVRHAPGKGSTGVGFRLFAINGEERAAWEDFVASHLYARQAA